MLNWHSRRKISVVLTWWILVTIGTGAIPARLLHTIAAVVGRSSFYCHCSYVDARPTDRGLAFWMANMHTYKLKESNFDGDGGGGAVAS